MGLREMAFGLGAKIMLERPAKKKSFDELIATLEQEGVAIGTRVNGLMDGEYVRKVLSHIIGIEQWGQQRLRVFLGQPFKEEEYDAYRPSKNIPIKDLRKLFLATRNESVKIAREISAKRVPEDKTVHHNDFGDITAKAWVHYLTFHAAQESRRMK